MTSDRDPRVDSGRWADDRVAARSSAAKALLLDAAIGHSECHSLGSGGMAVSGSDRGAPSNFTHASSLTANLMAAHPWANGRCGPEPRIAARRWDYWCGRSGDHPSVHRRGSIPRVTDPSWWRVPRSPRLLRRGSNATDCCPTCRRRAATRRAKVAMFPEIRDTGGFSVQIDSENRGGYAITAWYQALLARDGNAALLISRVKWRDPHRPWLWCTCTATTLRPSSF